LESHLEKLLRLQEVALAIEDLNRRLSSIPVKIQDLDQALARRRVDVAKSGDELAGLQKERRKLEGDLQSIEAKISKYQGQLMEVKTNKEYTAMLHEIEGAKSEKDTVDTRILQAMEATDTLEMGIRQKEKALAEEAKSVDAARGVLISEQKDLEASRARVEAERREVEAQIPAELVAEFNRISRSRGGLAVARVVQGLCQGCSVRIQPRIVQQIRRDEAILRCESCKRFLYYLEEKRAEPPTGQGA
jgi:predicted  nucleic acid-binding Zn-ribbon protein